MTARVKLTLDAKPLISATRELERDLDRLVHRFREVLKITLSGVDGIANVRSVNGHDRRAGRAGKCAVRFEPSENLLALMLAVRTFQRDLDAIKQRFQIKHHGTSGAAVGKVGTSKRRTGGRRSSIAGVRAKAGRK